MLDRVKLMALLLEVKHGRRSPLQAIEEAEKLLEQALTRRDTLKTESPRI